MSLGGNEIRVNGRCVGWVDQVRREADAVLAVLPAGEQASPTAVTPISFVHRASLPSQFLSECVGHSRPET